MSSEGPVTCPCQLPARACPRAGTIPDWHKRAWRRQHSRLTYFMLTSLVYTAQYATSRLPVLLCGCAYHHARPPLPPSPPQLLDPQGRHRPRVLRPSWLRKSSPPSSPAALVPAVAVLPHLTSPASAPYLHFAQLQLSGIHVLRTPPAPPSIHPPIHGRFISDILTLVTWLLHHAPNCLVPRTALLCRLQSALPGTTFTGGIVCRPNWCARATPTRRKYAQQPSVSDYVFRCAPVAPACLHLTCRQYTHAHRKQLSNQTNAVSCRAMLLVKSNKRKLLPACFLCALLIPLFSTAAPNQCWNPVSVPAGRASPSCQPAKGEP